MTVVAAVMTTIRPMVKFDPNLGLLTTEHQTWPEMEPLLNNFAAVDLTQGLYS